MRHRSRELCVTTFNREKSSGIYIWVVSHISDVTRAINGQREQIIRSIIVHLMFGHRAFAVSRF